MCALAVYLVVAFHTGLGLFTGGFIGVDVFFVLSGFLVTSILVWHWRLIIFVSLNHTIAPLPLFVLDTLGATALAALSFRILDSPIHFTTVLDRFRGPVIAIGFSTSILIGLVVVPVVLDAGSGAVAITEPGAGPHLLD